jgi:hypothetical protein
MLSLMEDCRQTISKSHAKLTSTLKYTLMKFTDQVDERSVDAGGNGSRWDHYSLDGAWLERTKVEKRGLIFLLIFLLHLKNIYTYFFFNEQYEQ